MAEEMATSAPARDAAAQKKYDAAMKVMDQGDFKKAHGSFKKFTEEYPDDAEGWYCRAECANYASGMFGAKIKDEEKLEVTEEAFNEYLNKVAEDVKATADQLKNYFGEAFIKAEQLKEMATNLIVDSAKVKAAEAEEKPKKARKPKAPKAEDKAEETEAAAEEPKAE